MSGMDSRLRGNDGGRTYPQTPSLKGRGWMAAQAARIAPGVVRF